MRSSRSKTVTVCPARLSWSAAASPAGPLPTTATRFPVRDSGGWATIHPSSAARSAMARSMRLMVTGGSVIPRTQASSQGAGQIRPVHSGKLLVRDRDSHASRHRPRRTRSFHSGIRLWRGHPVPDWQKGTPQSMHRAPCSFSASTSVSAV